MNKKRTVIIEYSRVAWVGDYHYKAFFEDAPDDKLYSGTMVKCRDYFLDNHDISLSDVHIVYRSDNG